MSFRNSLPSFLALAAVCGILPVSAAQPLKVTSPDHKTTISLQLEDNWKTMTEKDGAVSIDVPMSGVHIEVWALGVPSVDEAVKKAGELIQSQVTKFQVKETKTIKVAGNEGKQLTGTGLEADDGDPSNADVYLFPVDGKVFLVCAHGEGDGSVKNRPLVRKLLDSVKKDGDHTTR